MFKQYQEKIFSPNRLVFVTPGEAPAAQEAPKLTEGMDYKKMTPEQITKLAELTKNLNLGDMIKIGGDKGPVNVLNFKTALKAAVDKVPAISDLKLKNVDQFLLNGLLQNLGKADQKASEVGPNESKALNDMLVSKKVAQFKIEEGYWMFFDKEGNAVKQDYKLDDKDAKDPAKPGELVGATEVEKTAITQEVKNVKEVDVKAKQEEEAKQKEEAERTDVKNLEKVNSASVVQLKPDMKLAELAKSLSTSVTEEGKTARITEAEVSKALLDYVNKTVPAPQGVPADQVEAQRFTTFLQQVLGNGYDAVAVQNGKLLFSKAQTPVEGETKAQQTAREKSAPAPTSNPLNAQQKGRDLNAYAHENLIKNAEAKAEEESKAPQAGADKPTRFDSTAKEVARRLSGNKEASESKPEDLDKVDERYLNVMQAILNYKVEPRPDPPVKVDFPFNDGVIPCEFFLTNDGRFVITKDNRKVDIVSYTPRGQGKDALNDMQDHFARILNQGTLGQELQRANVEYKGNFEQWGEKIDSGPDRVNGGVKYEFDWETGALGDDPDVTFFPQPHGRIEVVVEQDDIGLKGEKEYRFNASGLSDALRVLKKLRGWVENKNGERDSDQGKTAEQERRFFEESDNGNRMEQMKAEARLAGAGDLLSVRSSRNILPDGKGGTMENNLGKFNNGHHFDFDWMQKLDPPQRMQMVHDGRGEYEYYLIPSNQKLGEFKGQPQEALKWGMRLVAEQRNYLAKNGGEKGPEKVFQTLLESINKSYGYQKYVLTKGVEVKGGTAEGLVDLSLPGMKARPFDFGTKEKPNKAAFDTAAAEGYFLAAEDPNAVGHEAKRPVEGAPDEKKEEPAKTGPEAPVENISVTNESAKEMPDAEKIDAALKEVFKKIQGDTDAIKSYVKSRVSDGASLAGEDAQKQYQERVWAVLAELTGVEVKPDDPNYQKNIVAALNKPKTREDVKKAISGEFAKNFPESVKAADTMPRCRSLVSAYLNDSRINSLKDSKGFDAEMFEKAKQAYVSSLKDTINKMFFKPKAATESPKKYDERIRKEMEQMLKTPEQFFSEYKANEEKRKPYEDYKNKEAKDQAARAAFETRRDNFHGMSFTEFEGTAMNRDLGGVALKTIKACQDLKPGNVFLSNLFENSPMSQKELMFNVSTGTAPNGIPMTLHFTKNGKGVDVSAAPGWNNPDRGRTKVAISEQPDLLATVLRLTSNDVPYVENLQSEQQKADAAKAEAEKAAAPAGGSKSPERGLDTSWTSEIISSSERKNDKEAVSDINIQMEAIKEILPGIDLNKPEFSDYRTYLMGLAENEPTSDKQVYQKKMWKGLSRIDGLQPHADETIETESYHKRVVDIMKNPDFAKKFKDSVIDKVPDGDILKDLPKTKSFIAGAMSLTKEDVGISDENVFNTNKELYINSLFQKLKAVLPKQKELYASFPPETSANYGGFDRYMVRYLIQNIKFPVPMLRERASDERMAASRKPEAPTVFPEAKTPEAAKKAIANTITESNYKVSPQLQASIAGAIEGQNLSKELKAPAGVKNMAEFVAILKQGTASEVVLKEFMAQNSKTLTVA